MEDASVAKKKTGRSAKKSAPRASGATSTPTGRQNVILERIEEQQRVVIEAVTSNREALERQILGLDQKLSSRIDVLEVAVRSLSTDVRKNSADILKNSADIQDLSAVVRQNSADILKNSADILKNSADIRKNSADILKTSADLQDLSAVVRQNSVDIQALGDKLDTKADAGQLSALAERVQALESPG